MSYKAPENSRVDTMQRKSLLVCSHLTKPMLETLLCIFGCLVSEQLGEIVPEIVGLPSAARQGLRCQKILRNQSQEIVDAGAETVYTLLETHQTRRGGRRLHPFFGIGLQG